MMHHRQLQRELNQKPRWEIKMEHPWWQQRENRTENQRELQ
jgi:hypothetical protein